MLIYDIFIPYQSPINVQLEHIQLQPWPDECMSPSQANISTNNSREDQH